MKQFCNKSSEYDRLLKKLNQEEFNQRKEFEMNE